MIYKTDIYKTGINYNITILKIIKCKVPSLKQVHVENMNIILNNMSYFKIFVF